MPSKSRDRQSAGEAWRTYKLTTKIPNFSLKLNYSKTKKQKVYLKTQHLKRWKTVSLGKVVQQLGLSSALGLGTPA